MNASFVSPTGKVITRCFEHWMGMVRPFVTDGRGSVASSEDAYQTVRHELLAACESCAAAENASEDEHTVARRIKECVSPWMNLESLRVASPEILDSLWRDVQELQRHLGGRAAGGGRSLTVVFLAVFLVIFAGFLALNVGGEWMSARPATQEIGRVIQPLVQTFQANRPAIRTGVIVACAGVLTFIGAYLVMRSPRVY